MPYKDKAKRKAHELEIRDQLLAYSRKYEAEHREERRLKRRSRYWTNREALLKRHKQYRLAHKEEMSARFKKRDRNIEGRHHTVKQMMKRDNISKEDLLWNRNFYIGLISDTCCHYCLGSLNETGAGLDRIHNDLGHVCFNVVPCCRRCNRIKGHDLSYDEMMLLAPILREIDLKKKQKALYS